jgi:hypothetical protein
MVYFSQDWIVNPIQNLLKRTMTYPGLEPLTFGLAVSIANHYTIQVISFSEADWLPKSSRNYFLRSPQKKKIMKEGI